MTTPTLCLNMIVKNEAKVITTLLESIVGFIDTFCICDTGSTDNTVDVITSFFKNNNISGKIIHEPFKNFGHNRTIAIQACLGMSDYILLLDADMALHWQPNVKSHLANADVHMILQGNQNFSYQNARIVRNIPNIKYIGVTHEFIQMPLETSRISHASDVLFIHDLGNGGCKSDKFERDIRLLEKGLIDEPINKTRYLFYLANSYYDTAQYQKAIDCYTQRLQCGGWIQELWYSQYRLGLCHMHLNSPSQAIHHWLEAYSLIPDRLENIYEIIKYYRTLPNHFNLAAAFDLIAQQVISKSIDRTTFLFNDTSIYMWRLSYERAIFGFYIGINDIRNEVLDVLTYCEQPDLITNTLNNLSFYKINLFSIEDPIVTTAPYPSTLHVSSSYPLQVESYDNLFSPPFFKYFQIPSMLSKRTKNEWWLVTHSKTPNSNGDYWISISIFDDTLSIIKTTGPLILFENKYHVCQSITFQGLFVYFNIVSENGDKYIRRTLLSRLQRLFSITPSLPIEKKSLSNL